MSQSEVSDGACERRIGFIGIIVENRLQASTAVNRVISDYHDRVLARVGLPRHGTEAAVITLVVEATTDELGAFTGRLGQIAGVSVKSALARR